MKRATVRDDLTSDTETVPTQSRSVLQTEKQDKHEREIPWEEDDEEVFETMLAHKAPKVVLRRVAPAKENTGKQKRPAPVQPLTNSAKKRKPALLPRVQDDTVEDINEYSESENEEDATKADEIFELPDDDEDDDNQEVDFEEERQIPSQQPRKYQARPSGAKKTSIETDASGKFESNRIIYDNNEDFQKRVEYGKNAGKWSFLDQYRPITTPVFRDEKSQAELYSAVTNYIETRNAVKSELTQDALYDFVQQVAGHCNTLAKRIGAPGMFGTTNGSGNPKDGTPNSSVTSGAGSATMPSSPLKKTNIPFSTFSQPPPFGSQSQTPPSSAGRGRGRGGGGDSSTNIASATGARKTTREKIADIEYVKKFDALTSTQQARIIAAETDEERSQLLSDMQRTYLNWIDKDVITGITEMSEIVYASMISSWRIITTTIPHMSGLSLYTFIEDGLMRSLFAEITALKVGIVRFLNPTRTQLDKNHSRLHAELSAKMEELWNYSYDRNSREFRVRMDESKYGRIRGAPPSPSSLSSMPTSNSNAYYNMQVGRQTIGMFFA